MSMNSKSSDDKPIDTIQRGISNYKPLYANLLLTAMPFTVNGKWSFKKVTKQELCTSAHSTIDILIASVLLNRFC